MIMRGFWQEGVRCDRETNEQRLRISHHPSGRLSSAHLGRATGGLVIGRSNLTSASSRRLGCYRKFLIFRGLRYRLVKMFARHNPAIKGDIFMAEKDLQGEAPESNAQQPQNQGQQGEKDTQPVPPQGQTTKAKNPSQKPILQGREPTPKEQEQIDASAEYWRRIYDEATVKDM